MARSPLPNPSVDLVQDGGSVLFSFIMGEQIEYPVNLNSLSNLPGAYLLQAVLVEARNIPFQTEKPSSIEPAGKLTTVNVRVPTYRGEWLIDGVYNTGELVRHGGKYYTKAGAPDNSIPPSDNPNWIETDRGRVYVQFNKELAQDWNVQPIVGVPTYGFFELAVTEQSGDFPRTWKPVRGMVEFLFSPTL